jgi:hypothetical protein
MKKALAGPAKRTSKKRKPKKLPERRAMIAAARRRLGAVLSSAARRTRQLDRALAGRIEKTRPVLLRRLHRGRQLAARGRKAAAVRLRPLAVLLLRVFSRGERLLRRLGGASTRRATGASGWLTPARAIAATILAASACLAVSQFVTYSSVEIGQPGYAGLPAATPPTVGGESAGEAHAFLLLPLALLAAVLAALAMRSERRGLGRAVAAIGLVCLAVILLVDLPAGQDAGAQSARFAGATAVLEGGFYAELAASAGLLIGGLLYYARPCRIRINLSGRAASARRRRRRRRDSSPRKGARRPSRPRSAAASAPASRP